MAAEKQTELLRMQRGKGIWLHCLNVLMEIKLNLWIGTVTLLLVNLSSVKLKDFTK